MHFYLTLGIVWSTLSIVLLFGLVVPLGMFYSMMTVCRCKRRRYARLTGDKILPGDFRVGDLGALSVSSKMHIVDALQVTAHPTSCQLSVDGDRCAREEQCQDTECFTPSSSLEDLEKACDSVQPAIHVGVTLSLLEDVTRI